VWNWSLRVCRSLLINGRKKILRICQGVWVLDVEFLCSFLCSDCNAQQGRTGRKVAVNLPGGRLDIEWGEDNHMYMTGPAELVYEGEIRR